MIQCLYLRTTAIIMTVCDSLLIFHARDASFYTFLAFYLAALLEIQGEKYACLEITSNIIPSLVITM
jgi:hypothetical protein